MKFYDKAFEGYAISTATFEGEYAKNTIHEQYPIV
jgi:hypothetical protein